MPVAAAQPDATTIKRLVDALRAEPEASSHAIREAHRQTTADEQARVDVAAHIVLAAARPGDRGGRRRHRPRTGSAPPGANIFTDSIVDDTDDRPKNGARAACNLWNRFVVPRYSIVIRSGLFTMLGSTIARAFEPYERGGVRYGMVEFNTRYLLDFTPDEVAGTIIHEIGHTLGFGWDEWTTLFDARTGRHGSVRTIVQAFRRTRLPPPPTSPPYPLHPPMLRSAS